MKEPSIYRMPEAVCPCCGYQMNTTSHLNPIAPKQGDFAVCFNCATVMVFEADRSIRLPKPGEWEDACRDQPQFAKEIAYLQAIVRDSKRDRDALSPDPR